MNEQNHPVFWPGWITKGRICGQGSGSLWELWREDGSACATVKYITVPERATETDQLLRQGKSLEDITAYYDHKCQRAIEEYEVNRELKGCRHVAMYRDMRRVQAPGGLGWNIMLMMDNLKPIDRHANVLSESQVVKLGRQVCMALEDSNRQDLIHGSITPRCIFQDEAGNYLLGGFGGDNTGMMGDFRAQEVAEGNFIDTRADVYSLGMVLYWLLNDRLLPRKDRSGPKNCSKKLQAVIMKAIDPDAGNRYQSPAELRQALDSIAFVAPETATKPGKKKKIGILFVVLLLLVGLGSAVFATVFLGRSPILMADVAQGDPETWPTASAFGGAYQRRQIRSVTFLSSLKDAPAESWDVSQKRDGTVRAWVVPNGNFYDLFIGAKGGVTAPENCHRMFAGYKNLLSVNLNEAFDTSNTTDMGGMFQGSGLMKLDTTGFDTSKVTDMGSMFENCSDLGTLNVSGFDTSAVTNMYGMFYGCSSLMKLDVSSFNTAKVKSMYCMFRDCSNLQVLDLSGFDTANVSNMYCMFYGCSSLTELDISGFDTGNVTDMSCMFYNCSNLRMLDVSSFNTANVTSMYCTFYGCKSLLALDVSGFNTANVTNMYCMFHSCSSLTELDVSGFDTGKVKNMSCMFINCGNLRMVDVSGFNISSVENYENFMDGGRKINGRPWEEFFKK